MLSQRLSKVSITIAMNHNGPRRFLVFVGGELGGFQSCSPELHRKKCEESLDCMKDFLIFANENYSITTQDNLPMPHS